MKQGKTTQKTEAERDEDTSKGAGFTLSPSDTQKGRQADRRSVKAIKAL